MDTSPLTSNSLEKTLLSPGDILAAFFPSANNPRDVLNADVVHFISAESWKDTQFYRDVIDLLKKLGVREVFPFTPAGVRLALALVYGEKGGTSYMPHDIRMGLMEILENPELHKKRKDPPIDVSFGDDLPHDSDSIHFRDPFSGMK